MKLLPLKDYDRVIISFSGGKDSLAMALFMMENCDNSKLELWHQEVDGRGGRMMDWPITAGYCTAVANHLKIPIKFQWREGGFQREMLRKKESTAPVSYERGPLNHESLRSKPTVGTRMKWPSSSANLNVRWCSAYLKIDVARRALNNDPRFKKGKFLYVTGERREESTARAKYEVVEEHACSTKDRLVHHWRPVLEWPEEDVWLEIKTFKIRPHPAYYLGWNRVSCALCIFGDKNQWASARKLMPKQFNAVAQHERVMGHTIRNGVTVKEMADQGESFLPNDRRLRALAMNEHYPKELVTFPTEKDWVLPAGAYKNGGGPT